MLWKHLTGFTLLVFATGVAARPDMPIHSYDLGDGTRPPKDDSPKPIEKPNFDTANYDKQRKDEKAPDVWKEVRKEEKYIEKQCRGPRGKINRGKFYTRLP